MINKRIIFSLLLCMPNLFGMHNSNNSYFKMVLPNNQSTTSSQYLGQKINTQDTWRRNSQQEIKQYSQTAARINAIGFNNYKKYNTFRSQLYESAKKIILNNINRKYGTNNIFDGSIKNELYISSEFSTTKNIKLSIDKLELNEILLKKNRDEKIEEYKVKWFTNFKNLEEIAALEEAYAFNKAKLDIYRELLSTREKGSKGNNQNEYLNEKSNNEIIIDKIFEANFTLKTDGLCTEQLIKNYNPGYRLQYVQEIYQRVLKSTQNLFSKLTEKINSRLSLSPLKELTEIKENLIKKVDKLEQEHKPLEKNENQKFKEYDDTTYFCEAERKELAIAEDALVINEARQTECLKLLETIENLIQSKNNENKDIPITIDKNTIIQVPLDKIKEKSFESAKFIAQENSKYVAKNSELKELTEPATFFYEKHQQYAEERIAAANNDLKSENILIAKDYYINEALEKVLIEHGENPDSFRTCVGNQSQQATHKQIIETGILIATDKNLTSDLINLCNDFVITANKFNQTGNIVKANGLVDICNGILYIGKGALTGAINSINPIRIAEGCIFTVSKIIELSEIATLGAIKNIPLENFKSIPVIGESIKKFQDNATKEYCEKLNTLKNNISEIANQLKVFYKNASKNEILEHGTSIIVEIALTGKVQKGLYKFFKNQVPKVENIIQKISNTKKIENIVISPAESVDLSIASSAIEMIEIEKNVFAPKNGIKILSETNNPPTSFNEKIVLAKELENIPTNNGTYTILEDGRNCLEHDGINRTLAPNHGNPSTAKPPRSWAFPKNDSLLEQLAMEEVMSNPNPATNGGTILKSKNFEMSDVKNNWHAKDGWVKVTKNIKAHNTTGQEVKIDIHYIWNTITNEAADFKFVNEKIK